MFQQLGVAVYIADDEAKNLMNNSTVIREKITALFGKEAYQNGTLNRKYIASKVFQDKELLQQLNAIVHPEVKKHFQQWVKEQNGIYVIKENAILFETGDNHNCDKTILVIAPEKDRIDRIKKRDGTTVREIESRMNNQWTDEQKIPLADIVIHNMGTISEAQKHVRKTHKILLKNFS